MRKVWPIRVSIHASAREASAAPHTARPAACVSIHASAREASEGEEGKMADKRCFNPRLRAGGETVPES